MLMIRRLAIPAVLLAVGLVAACGDDSDTNGMQHGSSSTTSASASASAATASTSHNGADVTFAQEMIQHHRQAVDMAELGATRASSAEVKQLAATVQKAQQPEIDTMSGWLTAWGEKVPAEGESMGHSGMDMSQSADPMPGMMTDAQMSELEKASGAAFDRMFLEMMIEHHTGAISMAKTEQSSGQNPDGTALAAKIVTDQTAEITTMRKMLQGL